MKIQGLVIIHKVLATGQTTVRDVVEGVVWLESLFAHGATENIWLNGKNFVPGRNGLDDSTPWCFARHAVKSNRGAPGMLSKPTSRCPVKAHQ